MAKYNGHKNWNHWNVSLWIKNDENLYQMALYFIFEHKQYGKDYAAEKMLECLHNEGITKTPDGAVYSRTPIRAAMVGM